MKKHLCLVLSIMLLVCVLCAMAAMPVAGAAGTVMAYATASAGGAYKAFDDFASNFSNRTVGTEAEHAAANWLAQQLVAMGYTSAGGGSSSADMCAPFTFTYNVSDGYYGTAEKTSSSYNVVAYKRCGVENASLLVIAAPYSNELDTVIGEEALKLEDAAYSASSVGVLLSVAAGLSEDNMRGNLSFDVAFAFLGAEYFNWAGTKQFIKDNAQPLLGAVYLSQVGVGDHLNIYYDEVQRAHGQYIDSFIAKHSNYDIQGKPFAPGYTAQVAGGNLPYGHIGLMGGNYLFMQEGVPGVHLFGYNWVGLNASESATHGDIVDTEYDTYANFLKVYGEDNVRSRLNTAAEALVTLVLTDRSLAQAFEDAQGDASYDALVSDAAYYGFRWSVVGLTVVVAVVLGLLMWRRAKNAGTPDFSVNSEFINGTEGDNSADVFGESDPIMGENGAVDDDPFGADHNDNDDNTGNPPDTNDIFGEF